MRVEKLLNDSFGWICKKLKLANSDVNSTAALHSVSTYESKQPIFIIGCGRSGTGLLFDLMKLHPSLAATTGYPDGEDHVGWIEHGNCAISGFGAPQQNGGHTGFHYCLHMDESNLTPEIKANMHQYYYEEVSKLDPAKRVINKCPHISNKLQYVRAIFPDAKFVHIIRDCLPMVYSWVKIMKSFPHQTLYWPDTVSPCFWVLPSPVEGDEREQFFKNEARVYPGGGEKLLVDYWIETNRNILHQLENTPDQLMTIRYEDLIANPSEILAQLIQFCELDPLPDNFLSAYTGEIRKDNNTEYMGNLTIERKNSYLDHSYETRKLFGYEQ
jgi:hypothetical protein